MLGGVVATEVREDTLKDPSEVLSVQIHSFIGGPPREGFLRKRRKRIF